MNNESYGLLLNLNSPSSNDVNEVITNEKFISFQKSIRDLSNAQTATDETCKELGIPSEDAKILKSLFSASYKDLTNLRDRFMNKEISFENLNPVKTLRKLVVN